ncbi:MAG: FAD-dependent oxidoreductase [Candidatus Moranbacteria bacterium]|nr:FAD-dependent oxidoreductase [Candidatus Moranbacteria bacterium]
MQETYDLIIIGAGPAGLAASIYASRYKLNHLLLGATIGGQINEIRNLENWPGDISVSGYDLLSRFVEHAKSLGVTAQSESVVSVKKNAENLFEVETGKNTHKTRAVIMAMGTEYRKMNIPGEKELTGKGVSYCATCDAMFFRGKVICVVGGGNAAVTSALGLTDFASKVYLIYRGDRLPAEPIWLEKVAANPKIEVIRNTNIIEIKGEQKVENVVLDKAYEDKNHLDVDGVFVEIGSEPGVELARTLGVEIDEQGYIKVSADMSTNISGVFAAGDITTGSNKFRQIITATAEGAIAANGAYKMLKLK